MDADAILNVPGHIAPGVGSQDKFLRGDGTWQSPPTGTTVEETTESDIDKIIAGTFA